MNIPIFITIDKNYIIPAITLIASVCENTDEFCNFHVLNCDLTSADKKFFNKNLAKYNNLSIEYISVDKKYFKDVPNNKRFPISIYFRFLIPEIKKDLDKAIYFDVDMIVNDDIKDLFNINLEDKPIGAVKDKGIKSNENFNNLSNLLNLDLKNYFNAGVLVLNLKYFRENNITEKLFKTLKEYKDKIKYFDQDILNILFSENYKRIDLRWNCFPSLENILKENKDSDIEEFDNVKIYHYAGGNKPWYNSSVKCNLWFEYANAVIPEKDFKKFIKKQINSTKYKYNLLERIFSVINEYSSEKKYKVITILGIRIKFKINR